VNLQRVLEVSESPTLIMRPLPLFIYKSLAENSTVLTVVVEDRLIVKLQAVLYSVIKRYPIKPHKSDSFIVMNLSFEAEIREYPQPLKPGDDTDWVL
jgi:hypothetical protein